MSVRNYSVRSWHVIRQRNLILFLRIFFFGQAGWVGIDGWLQLRCGLGGCMITASPSSVQFWQRGKHKGPSYGKRASRPAPRNKTRGGTTRWTRQDATQQTPPELRLYQHYGFAFMKITYLTAQLAETIASPVQSRSSCFDD